MEVNLPDVLGEVTRIFEIYECALASDDQETLNRLFWNSALTLRFGVGEALYGHRAIVDFRKARAGGSPQRTLQKTVITTFGRDFATANTEFLRVGGTRAGRQSQCWVRFAEGWRIVAAHVSLQAEVS